MAENPKNVNTPPKETHHRFGKEPMGSRRTRSRRTQHGSGRNPGMKDKGSNREGAQPMGESTYETENCHLRHYLEQAQRWNAELECDAAVGRTVQGTNTQNQPKLGVRRPRGKPRGSRTRRQENAQEEQPGENEIPLENPND
uniref:Uncharacterized protein n=1 Tax=Cannabis sativa TaxID=3483 RepID=A0A803QHW0_CANSA